MRFLAARILAWFCFFGMLPMSTKTFYSCAAYMAIAAMAVSFMADAGEAVAQNSKPRSPSSRLRKPGGGVVKTPQKGSAPAAEKKSDGADGKTPSKGPGEQGAGGAPGKQSTSPASWMRENLWLMLTVPLGAAVLGFSWFFLVGRRRQGAHDDLFPGTAVGAKKSDKNTGGFSSTRIRAEDVKARLSGSVGGEEVETDQDYALVVEEDALSVATGSEEGSAEEAIGTLLGAGDFEAAYELYAQRIDEERSTRFDSSLEKELGEKLIEAGQDEKAARVLEQHIATHPADQIEAEAYFNLGYLHYRASHLDKSRKYFGLFIKSEPDEKRRDRATAILAALDAR